MPESDTDALHAMPVALALRGHVGDDTPGGRTARLVHLDERPMSMVHVGPDVLARAVRMMATDDDALLPLLAGMPPVRDLLWVEGIDRRDMPFAVVGEVLPEGALRVDYLDLDRRGSVGALSVSLVRLPGGHVPLRPDLARELSEGEARGSSADGLMRLRARRAAHLRVEFFDERRRREMPHPQILEETASCVLAMCLLAIASARCRADDCRTGRPPPT